MTAPLKTIEAVRRRHHARDRAAGAAAARVLALAPTAQKDEALAAMAEAIRARKAKILAANAEDVAEAKAARRHRRLPRPAGARRQARRRDGGRRRRGARARRSGRHRHRALDAAERHDHRARARAARRRRHHLREPPERHRRRRRALPQGRQCRDPARRLGEPCAPTRAIHAALARGLAAAGPARGRDPARADARPRRGRHDAARASTARST